MAFTPVSLPAVLKIWVNKMSEDYTYAATVVIPVYNGAAFIEGQLRALAAQQTDRSFEVVISNNGSTDSTVKIVESFKAPFPLRIVDSSQHQGICHARNVGVREARGKIILFCDADDYVEPGWVEAHLAAHDQHAPALIAGAVLHGDNPPEALAAYGIATDEDQRLRKHSGELEPSDMLTPYAGFRPSAVGCNFSVPRDVYLGQGGMDLSYVGGSEETDFTWRLMDAGIPMYKASVALVSYKLRTTPRAIFRQQRNYQRNKMLLWTRFKAQGMRGSSLKYSIVAFFKALPLLFSPATRLEGARLAGGNLGAIQGIIKYRMFSAPERQLMNNR